MSHLIFCGAGLAAGKVTDYETGEKVEKIIEYIEDLEDSDYIFSLEEFENPEFWDEKTLSYILQNTSVTKKEFYQQTKSNNLQSNLRVGR